MVPFPCRYMPSSKEAWIGKAGITSKSACNDLATDNWQARHETTAEDGTIAKARTKAIS